MTNQNSVLEKWRSVFAQPGNGDPSWGRLKAMEMFFDMQAEIYRLQGDGDEPRAPHASDWCSLCGATVTLPHEHFTPEHNALNRPPEPAPPLPTVEFMNGYVSARTDKAHWLGLLHDWFRHHANARGNDGRLIHPDLDVETQREILKSESSENLSGNS